MYFLRISVPFTLCMDSFFAPYTISQNITIQHSQVRLTSITAQERNTTHNKYKIHLYKHRYIKTEIQILTSTFKHRITSFLKNRLTNTLKHRHKNIFNHTSTFKDRHTNTLNNRHTNETLNKTYKYAQILLT